MTEGVAPYMAITSYAGVEQRVADHLEGSDGPQFTVAEFSKAFLGHPPHMLRWRDQHGHLVWDGKPVGQRRDTREGRIYGLRDVEEVLLALGQCGAIEPDAVARGLLVVRQVLSVYGIEQGNPKLRENLMTLALEAERVAATKKEAAKRKAKG